MAIVHKEKKNDVLSVRLTESQLQFIKSGVEKLELESPPEFIRYLINSKMAEARHELIMLSQSLGVNVSSVIIEVTNNSSGEGTF